MKIFENAKKNIFNFVLLLALISWSAGLHAQCNYVEGTINFTANGGNTGAGYTNEYLLTDASGLILQINSSPSFTNVTAGSYNIYNLNYETANGAPTGNTVGQNVSGIGGLCIDLSTALPINVCNISIEWTDATASDQETSGGNLPTLTISGGDISTVTMSTAIEVAFTGSATQGSDYAPATTPITLTIPKGDYSTATTLNLNDLTTDDLSITDDQIVESDETIVLTLQNAIGMDIDDADGSTVTESVHTYTIIDDDVLLVEFDNATATDVETTGGNLPQITVSGGITTAATTVEITLNASPGTATAGTDYSPDFSTVITVTIPAGDYTTATNLAIPGLSVTDDSIVEANETFVLDLQNPSTGVNIGDADGGSTTEGTHTYTIIDDDCAAAAQTLSIN